MPPFKILLLVMPLVLGCSQSQNSQNRIISPDSSQSGFYSTLGAENKVSFTAISRHQNMKVEDLKKMSPEDVKYLESSILNGNLKFMFGPLTDSSLAGIKTNGYVKVDLSTARQVGDNVEVQYYYRGQWLVSEELRANIDTYKLPLPYDSTQLMTPKWKKCTDSAPEHQTQGFFWYFWDPKRWGCDHELGVHYQLVNLTLQVETKPQTETFPNYDQLAKSAGVENNLQGTFAFGYVSDQPDANPDQDSDYGMDEYRSFIRFMDAQAIQLKLEKVAITQKEYLNPRYPDKVIGYKYSGLKNGVKLQIKVVTSADIDQMILFTQSYAHDHDGFFSWFGHSRVGSGFDAENVGRMIRNNPEYYSLTKQYQLIYWAGCNSYAYYTDTFFRQKAALDLTGDPNGTMNLDIINNGLPSLFSFNAQNAIISYNALINWENPTSYQSIVNQIEENAKDNGTLVLVNVLGDEDNSK